MTALLVDGLLKLSARPLHGRTQLSTIRDNGDFP
jgi:hypothetical protein